MAKGDIIEAFTTWHDSEQTFCVYLSREGEDGLHDIDGATPLRPLHRIEDDPVEARIVWDAMIYCPKDVGGQGAGERILKFERKAQAKRVASRANKTLADIKKGVPPLSNVAAQMTYLLRGGNRPAPMFNLDTGGLRSKIEVA